MKKIPTLFVRDPNDLARVLPAMNPGCEWALTDPAARATRKYDGTCVMLDVAGRWWARREVKADRPPPANWWQVDQDPVTGKRTGWEPVEQSSFAKWHAQAVDRPWEHEPGTYELVGPRVNGNPEKLDQHAVILHSAATVFPMDRWLGLVPVGDAFDVLRRWLTALSAQGVEGIVWHHPDGRMVKLKGRDFVRGAGS